MITLVLLPDQFSQDQLELRDHKYRHLFRARRMVVGEEIRLVDGRGSARIGVVELVKRDWAQLRTGGSLPPNEPGCQLDLLVPIPKPSRLAWMVEKATEVGVHSIRLISSERAPRLLGKATLERLGRVAEAAVEQSQRAHVPEISGPHEWAAIDALVASSAEKWVLIPTAKTRLAPARGTRAALVVGPEGGFAAAEVDDLVGWGWRSARLGATLLRIETAAVVGSATLLI